MKKPQSIKTHLPLSEITTDFRLQVRTDAMLQRGQKEVKGLRLEAMVDRIATSLEAGQKIEPIKVIRHGGEYLVFDGHHRLKAYQEAFPNDDPQVAIEIMPFSYHEALAKGYYVNTTHGEGLNDTERSQAALRSCVYSHEDIKAKALQREGIKERLAQKITQAARQLKKEAEINPSDNPDEIDEKIGAWINRLPRNCYSSDGARLFKLDDHRFPTYRFILERKANTREPTQTARVAALTKTLEAIVDEDYIVFLKALKKVAHKNNRDLNITVHRIEEPKYYEDDEDADF
ncbi:ParB-like nuclease domain-containing protein [Paraneptunicella aestuarii]|uniref:ParB N-terminal domain-containing protein n=1 Tax=Paraneptunicella aestuarii TaxID=2831148 RepID=UPI001E2B7A91|nr:ParB N-terminal domain-containing protein [Paraneptunicella aestuarii]UAA39603.1 ParB-like nuclease domain-containing protein [Paraneptunicella aestuarii]